MTPKELALEIVNDPHHERARRRFRAFIDLEPAGEPMLLLLAVLESLEDLPQERHVLTALACEGLGGPTCIHGDPWAPRCTDPACPACGKGEAVLPGGGG
jgi:hypothetical protein